MSPNITMVLLVLLSLVLGIGIGIVHRKLVLFIGIRLNKRYGDAVRKWCRSHRLPLIKNSDYPSDCARKQ